MKYYYKNAECTIKAFDEDGYLCTGDLGYFDNNFCFYVESRINDVIVYRQWQVSNTVCITEFRIRSCWIFKKRW